MNRKIKLTIGNFWKELSFVFFTLRKNIESSAELRASFMATAIGMMLNNASFLVIWVALGSLVGDIAGWRAVDVFGFLGFSTLSYGIVFTFFGGIRELPDYVLKGNLDQFLLSPKNLLWRISTSKLYISAVGDIFFGIICLAVWLSSIGFSISNLLLILFFVLIASIVTFGYTVFACSFAFYFVQSKNITQGLFELFIGPSLSHGGAIQGNIRKFFIFVVPALLAGALPVEIIKDFTIVKFAVCSVIAFFWIIFPIHFFYKSIKKYESSNFVNFG